MNLDIYELIPSNNKSFPKDQRITLKVHSEEVITKYIYENFSFKEEGIDPKNSNLIYCKKPE